MWFSGFGGYRERRTLYLFVCIGQYHCIIDFFVLLGLLVISSVSYCGLHQAPHHEHRGRHNGSKRRFLLSVEITIFLQFVLILLERLPRWVSALQANSNENLGHILETRQAQVLTMRFVSYLLVELVCILVVPTLDSKTANVHFRKFVQFHSPVDAVFVLFFFRAVGNIVTDENNGTGTARCPRELGSCMP